ncbi:MAG: hypothetical protein IT376_11565 [Polyangiaceae bacterium]|nr:hypothetical protein [Polyangiaceae bacterium]
MPSCRRERAFVAVSYLLGGRGPELVRPLEAPEPQVLELVARLGHVDRGARAAALAAELGRVARALEEWEAS